MKIKLTILVLIGLIVTLFLAMASYGVNMDEAVIEAKNTYYQHFEQHEIAELNYESEQVKLFLPNGLKVVEETDYNLVIENSGQDFLLFFNPFEQTNSRVHYDLDVDYQDEALLFETYETDEMFSYILILEEENDLNVVIALGGAKVSTKTTTAMLTSSVDMMLDMLHSLSYSH